MACKPCLRLSQFYEKHREILDANYVYIKIFRGRFTHAEEVMKRLRSAAADGIGIPWIAILDPDAKVQSTFLGFPSTDPKDIDEFVQFLSKTAPRLTAEQLSSLRDDLGKKSRS